MDEWKLIPARDLKLDSGQRISSLERETNYIEFCSGQVLRIVTKVYLNLFHSLKIYGLSNLPENLPFVLVGNHSSHLDALLLANLLPARLFSDVHPIAAADMFFKNRPRSILSALTVNALPISRKSPKKGAGDIRILRERLLHGHTGYIIFPEGTRTRTGDISEFKRGVGMLLASTTVPAVPCFIEGAFKAFPPEAKLPKLTPLSVKIGHSLEFSKVPDDSQGWQAVAQAIEKAVRQLANEDLTT